jgi:hypothetical protein
MMEYPGTMRPGKTPENMPFHDLPLDDAGPRDPVPWPHFQQIAWHHQWEPPHDHPVPIEEFIEMQGRWSTPELEARMRMGARQLVRDSRENEEESSGSRRQNVITDDDDDEYDDAVVERNVALGEGVFGKLGSDADRAATEIATTPRIGDGDDDVGDGGDNDDVGLDFLLDLGLDMLDVEEEQDSKGEGGVQDERMGARGPALTSSKTRGGVDDDDDDSEFDDEYIAPTSTINVEVDEEDEDEDVIDFGVVDDDDDDVDVGIGMDDDEDLEVEDDVGVGGSSGLDEVSLDDYGDNDGLDNDIFEEGGFDYDDYDNDNDGGDMW